MELFRELCLKLLYPGFWPQSVSFRIVTTWGIDDYLRGWCDLMRCLPILGKIRHSECQSLKWQNAEVKMTHLKIQFGTRTDLFCHHYLDICAQRFLICQSRSRSMGLLHITLFILQISSSAQRRNHSPYSPAYWKLLQCFSVRYHLHFWTLDSWIVLLQPQLQLYNFQIIYFPPAI